MAVYEDDTDYDYRQHFREFLAALRNHSLADEEFQTENVSPEYRYLYAALRVEVMQQSPLILATLYSLNNREISQNWSKNQKSVHMSNESQAVDEPSSLIAASLPNWSKDFKIWAMFGGLEQSNVVCLNQQSPSIIATAYVMNKEKISQN